MVERDSRIKHKCNLLSNRWPSGERGVDPDKGNIWQNMKSNIRKVQGSYMGCKRESHSIQQRDVEKLQEGRDI